ncbi:MAG: hypothetical protein NC548_48935 [Lachnospiraceae bacterium]|nr:hypothetical protein [Lachnospiraceae bacterium]
MKFFVENKKDIFFYSVLACAYLLLLALVARNLSLENFWYDESGQFFISKGLNHWSRACSPEGDLAEVLYNNAHYNQDPGGYSILLHYWSMVSDNHVWLRLLSYVFFVGAILFTILTVSKILGNKKFGAIGGLLVFPLLAGSQAYELRAYGMELCGVVFGLWLIFYLRDRVTYRRLLIGSVVLALFITSRYTMLMIAFVYTCFILADIWKTETSASVRFRQMLVFSVPLVVTVLSVYFLAMRIQNSTLRSFSYITYLETHMRALLFWLVTVGLILTWKWQTGNVRVLLKVFVAVNVLFLFFGWVGMLPWNISGMKGGPFLLLFYISVYCSMLAILLHIKISTYTYWVVFCGCVLLITGVRQVFGIANVGSGYREDTVSVLRDLGSLDKDVPVYLGRWLSPDVRFIYEYGCLRDSAAIVGYPDRFIQLPAGDHTGMLKKLDYMQEHVRILENASIGSICIADSTSPLDTIPPCFVNLKKNIYIKI